MAQEDDNLQQQQPIESLAASCELQNSDKSKCQVNINNNKVSIDEQNIKQQAALSNANNNNNKPNGLKNRIIQRPPPLILDKVSNFYEANANHSNTVTQSPGRIVVKTAPAISLSTSAKLSAPNLAVGLGQRESIPTNELLPQTALSSTIAASNVTNSSNQINTIGEQQSATIASTNSANHKFWASLNRNVSRVRAANKAAAINSSNSSSQSANLATEQHPVDSDGLGADLIIRRRDSSNSNGQLTCVLASPMSKQQHQIQTLQQVATGGRGSRASLLSANEANSCSLEVDDDEADENFSQNVGIKSSADKQPQKDHLHELRRQISTNSIESDSSKPHNLSNFSSEPDDAGENHGGNLIGVDQPPTPTLLATPTTAQTHDVESSLASATSSRPRSNNPFLDVDDEEDEFNFNNNDRNTSQREANSPNATNSSGFNKRPASFIAATDKQRNALVSANLAEQAIVNDNSIDVIQAKFNQLNLSDNSSYTQHSAQLSHHQTNQFAADTFKSSTNDAYNTTGANPSKPVSMQQQSLDQRDSSNNNSKHNLTQHMHQQQQQTMTNVTDAVQHQPLPTHQLHNSHQQMTKFPPPQQQHQHLMANQQSIYGIYSQNQFEAPSVNNTNTNGNNSYTLNKQPPIEPTISLDSESTVCKPPPSATMQLPHWTDAIYELKNAILETRSIAGGAENGEFIYIVESGDIILQLDNVKVSGYTLEEFNELLVDKSMHLLSAVQTKHSFGLTKDLKQYLSLSFPKDSQDRELQNLIRENVYRRTIPCTTRSPKDGELDKVDYYFLTKEQFIELNNRDVLLECGSYAGHYYGTMRPLVDLESYLHYGTLQPQTAEVPADMRQPLVSNHPALIGLPEPPLQASLQPVDQHNDDFNPLYENHESMKMHRLHEATNAANTNGLTLGQHRPLPMIEATISPHTQKSDIVAVDNEALPHGWERVIDQTHGAYYIDHNTQRTQYERPYEIELTKGSMGFGFTLVETDNNLLLVRSVIPGGPAYSSGIIRPGDILISAVGVSVSGLAHTDVARLFSTFAVGDRVRLTFARSQYVVDSNFVPDEYLFSNGTNGDLAVALNADIYGTHPHAPVNPISNTNMQQYTNTQSPNITVNQEFDFVNVTLKRGDQGFGFKIVDSVAGQKVREIQNNQVCANLKQGDVLISLNGQDITKLSHKAVVEKLKNCPPGEDVNLVVKRKRRFRSKTPNAMHTESISEFSPNITPQRNCKTPNVDSLMLRRSKHQDPVSRTLFAPPDNPNSYMPSIAQQLPPIPYPVYSNSLPIDPNYVALQHHQASLGQQQQPIYGTHPSQQSPLAPLNIPRQQRFYADSLDLAAPPIVSSASNNANLAYHNLRRPSSIANSEAMIQDLGTNSVNPSEVSLPAIKFANVNGLSQINQYNTFMNNDKLMMMRMHQQQQNQQSQYQKIPPPPPPHPVPNLASSLPVAQQLASDNIDSDYHHMPLYSNSEIIKNEQRGNQLPMIPAKPLQQQYLPMIDQFNNNSQNYYANNEEIALQQMQYGSLPPMDLNNQQPATYQSSAQLLNGSNYGPNGIASYVQSQPPVPTDDHDEYELHQIDLDRENNSNWGIRLIGGSEVDRAISIGSIVFGGAASKNGQLKSGDEIISINGMNVVGATHQHVVELISACANRASLVIKRRKFAEACEVVLTKNSDEGFGFVIISSGNCALIGRIIDGSPADRCKQLHVRDRIIAVNGRYITPDMQHPEIVNMIKECGSTLRLRIIPLNCYTVELIKNVQSDNFGFSMRGGSEYDGTPLYILRVAPNGLARDLLNVGDQIIEINGIPTVGMTHQQAATIIKFSDPIVKLKLRRNYETPPSLLVDSPRALQKFNQVTAEMKTVNPNVTPTNFNQDNGVNAGSNLTDFGGSFVASGSNLVGHQQQQQPQLMYNDQQQQQQVNTNQVYGQSLPLYAA